MVKLLLLLIIFSCSSKPKVVKEEISSQNQDELIQSYINFYSYSLKDDCPGIDFDKSLSKELDSRTFDLSQGGVEGQYVYMGKEIKELAGREVYEEPKPLKMILLKERRSTQSYYRLCADKSNEPINCTDDVLMNKIIKTKSLAEVCGILSSRTLPISKDEAAQDIVTVMRKLHIEHTKAP